MSSLLRELVEAANGEDNKRRSRAEHDFAYFCNTYLPHYFSCEPAEYQLALYDVISQQAVDKRAIKTFKKWTREDFKKYLIPTKTLRGIFDIEPREHGKSVRLTFAYPLWCALFRKRRFIVLFGATDTDAKSFLENIKNELEDNELILEDFGEMQGKQWGANQITLSNDTAIAAKGRGSTTRGMRYHEHRPDLVILDDIIKDEEAESKDRCRKVLGWFKRVAFNLGKGCFMVMVNTHFNDDDPITVLQQEVLQETLKDYLCLRFGAELEDGTPLWEARWSKEDLARKRSEIGSTPYLIEYLSLSVASDSKLFKPTWFQYVDVIDLDFSTCSYFFGVDPNAEGADDAAIAVLAFDKITKERTVVSWWSKPYGSRKDLVDKLIQLYEMWKPEVIGFEEVGFQKIYKEMILEKGWDRGFSLPVEGIKPGSASKKSRAMQYQPYIESGLLRFASNMKESKEMDMVQAFPTSGVNDGLIDAIYYALFASLEQKVKTPYARAIKRLSPLTQTLRRYRGVR